MMLSADITVIRGSDIYPHSIVGFNNIDELMNMFFNIPRITESEDDSEFHVRIYDHNEINQPEPSVSMYIKIHILSMENKIYEIIDYPNTDNELIFIDSLIENAQYIHDYFTQCCTPVSLMRAVSNNKKGLELLKNAEMFSKNMSSLEKNILLESFCVDTDIAEKAYIALHGKVLSNEEVNKDIIKLNSK